jgi:hypothetical protein
MLLLNQEVEIMMIQFALLAVLSAAPDPIAIEDFDAQDAQNHAEAANRLALGEVLTPNLSWPIPDWAFAEMPWISVSGIRRTGQVVAFSIASAAVEMALQLEEAAAAAYEAAHEAERKEWQTALDWAKVGESLKDQYKPSPFDAKMSPFGLEGDNE